ncbi:DUF5685 family protein [Nocardia arizonensis]|uniref:DUF5685 family protein n=1 Tax=Nocardia arizonensis TaxID=1141647 RepID=UPI000A883B77|nr:DUF5685 family protein [Nocardia arizonensis]
MLRPCSHGAEKYGVDPAQWRAHMCGLCLGLRDGHGQLARTATNTDAIVLSVLTEAQRPGGAARTVAGPCALRGMRRAQVATADSAGVRLAATASLLLGSAKIRDHVDDRDGSVLTRRPMTGIAARWADRARVEADRIGLDVGPLVNAIEGQADLERRAAADSTAITLDQLTEPTQLCAAELFGHTAVLAERAANLTALREAGRHFGRIAHLADAVEDFDADRARGRFNPLDATGTTMPQAYDLMRESDSALRHAIAEAELAETPTVRWILLDPLNGLLRRVRHGIGGTIAHACSATREHTAHANLPGHRPPTRRPDLGAALGIVLGVYCTGWACCSDHTSPCTGERKDAWIKNCDCGDCCDGCDCCGNCCECDGC